MNDRPALAAVIYRENEAVDALLAEFRRWVEARGGRVGGVVQTPCDETIYATQSKAVARST